MKRVVIVLFFLFTFSMIQAVASINSLGAPGQQQPIKGIYVKAFNTQGPQFNKLLSIVNQTDLNAMVIDIKDDNGNLTFNPPKNSLFHSVSRPYIKNPTSLMQTLKTNNIYPIARIVVFKDNVLSNKNPNVSFKTASGLWKNRRGDSFTNPFLKEVWDYNIGIAMEAINIGFKEIQFDYVRFPENFETFEGQLTYDKGSLRKDGRERIAAVSEFVKYAKEKLKPWNVKMSVDVFGYATVIPEAPGIGQNFSTIAQHVDVISAMIYPSHWTSQFGIQKPDLQPFLLVKEYAKVENARLSKIVNPPISRPWLQDFSAAWLGRGNYMIYGKKEIEEQIRALHSEGINEFLLWNAGNNYTPNVDYTPY